MSVAGALDGVAKCIVKINNLDRDLDDGDGFITKPEDGTCTIEATVLPISLKELKASPDGSVGVDDLNMYIEFKLVSKLNDTVEIEGITYTVKSSRFRREGGYTKTRIREITRRATTN